MTSYPKRLIEVDFHISEIFTHMRREKSFRDVVYIKDLVSSG
jgi:hypothetical protein